MGQVSIYQASPPFPGKSEQRAVLVCPEIVIPKIETIAGQRMSYRSVAVFCAMLIYVQINVMKRGSNGALFNNNDGIGIVNDAVIRVLRRKKPCPCGHDCT